MKNLKYLLFTGILMILLNSCQSQNMIVPEKLANLIESEQFTFVAQRANPMGTDVANIMTSLPNSSSSRFLDLDSGYSIEIRKENLEVALPYFGRMYSANPDPQKNSYRFSSKNYSINQAQSKKGNTVFTIKPLDQQNVRRIVIEVFKNGKAFVSMDSTDRQPISYEGYITENSIKK